MGALRFKLDPEGPFLAQNHIPIPPFSSIRELQQAANVVEGDTGHQSMRKWLAILLAPGSSLGGARPKANVKDEAGELWIAKFPSRYDDVDKGAWEYVLYQLACNAGITMAESRILKVGNQFHTFLTKRFDRQHQQRIHFASAMTMTGNNEETIKEKAVSYLDLAEFIRFSGANAKEDLPQLWRRIVFHLAVSNTDDHLRNHGFLLSPQGWRLSPAYDLNPSMDKDGLSLNIDMESNALSYDLAFSVGQYFDLDLQAMQGILEQVQRSVRQWRSIALKAGIRKAELDLMASAFKV
jgi:serine/threonine-protein kinase HipA